MISNLKTDFKEDVLATSQKGKRTFNIVDKNGDILFKDVHIEDVSQYLVVGDDYGQDIINQQNKGINQLNAKCDELIEFMRDGIASSEVTHHNSNVESALDSNTKAIKEVKSVLGTGTVNLINSVAGTSTVGGITCTANGDGTYTLNGTTTTQKNFFPLPLGSGYDAKAGVTYKLCGCPSGGSSTTYLLIAEGELGELYKKTYAYDYGNGVTFTVPQADINAGYKLRITISIRANANNLLFKPMLTTDLQATYDDYVPYDNTSNVAELYPVKHRTITNLLNPTLQARTVNGVTCTANGDGTYTVNGTASSDKPADFHIITAIDHSLGIFEQFRKGQILKLVGCPKNGGSNTYRLSCDIRKANWEWLEVNTDTGDGIQITYKGSEPQNTLYLDIYIRISKNATVNNLLFKPMLTTDLQATYDDYVPYSGDGELNKNVADLYPVKHRTMTNLLNPTLQTTTVNGVTCTNNGDGTYTVSGTATADTRIPIEYGDDIDAVIPNGKTVKLIGCPKGGTRQSYFLYTQSINHMDYGDGVIFDWNTEIGAVAIFVQKGQTVTNLLYKPMLTTDLTATYDDYVQYSGNGELNENVAELKNEVGDLSKLDTTDKTDLVSAINEAASKGGTPGVFYNTDADAEADIANIPEGSMVYTNDGEDEPINARQIVFDDGTQQGSDVETQINNINADLPSSNDIVITTVNTGDVHSASKYGKVCNIIMLASRITASLQQEVQIGSIVNAADMPSALVFAPLASTDGTGIARVYSDGKITVEPLGTAWTAESVYFNITYTVG